jgi:hypothetical protein
MDDILKRHIQNGTCVLCKRKASFPSDTDVFKRRYQKYGWCFPCENKMFVTITNDKIHFIRKNDNGHISFAVTDEKYEILMLWYIDFLRDFLNLRHESEK